jgi:hypothetical protein
MSMQISTPPSRVALKHLHQPTFGNTHISPKPDLIYTTLKAHEFHAGRNTLWNSLMSFTSSAVAVMSGLLARVSSGNATSMIRVASGATAAGSAGISLASGKEAFSIQRRLGVLKYLHTGQQHGLFAPPDTAAYYRRVQLPALQQQSRLLDVGLTATGGLVGNNVGSTVAIQRGWDAGREGVARLVGTVAGGTGGFSLSRMIHTARLNALQFRVLDKLRLLR